ELWSRSVPHLLAAGNSITVYKNKFNQNHSSVKNLAVQKITLKEIRPSLFIGRRLVRKLGFFWNRLRDPLFFVDEKYYAVQNFKKYLFEDKPDLVVISQGINFDGLKFAYQCLKLKIPYVIIS